MARPAGKDRGLVERPTKSGVWWVRCYLNGRERWWKVGAKSSARAFYEKIKTEGRERRLKLDAYRRRNVLLSAYLDDVLATSTKRTMREDRRFAAFWKVEFSGRTLDSIGPAEIEHVRTRLLEEGKSPATSNRYVAFLKHVYYRALRDGKVDSNPIVHVKLFKEFPGRLRFLTEGEEARLREVMAPEDWALVALGLYTGLRRSEQFGLKWQYVDLDNRVLTIPRSKSGQIRHVPLNDAAVAILKGLTSWMTSPWVFPSSNPGRPLDAQNVYNRVFLPALKQARIEGVVWHTLRHTFASRLVMAGVDLRSVQELLGHHSLAMVMRYTHLSPGHLQEAVGRLVASPAQAKNEDVTVTKTVTEPEPAPTT